MVLRLLFSRTAITSLTSLGLGGPTATGGPMLGRWCHKNYVPTCDPELKAVWAAADNSCDPGLLSTRATTRETLLKDVVPWEHPTLLCYASDTFGY